MTELFETNQTCTLFPRNDIIIDKTIKLYISYYDEISFEYMLHCFENNNIHTHSLTDNNEYFRTKEIIEIIKSLILFKYFSYMNKYENNNIHNIDFNDFIGLDQYVIQLISNNIKNHDMNHHFVSNNTNVTNSLLINRMNNETCFTCGNLYCEHNICNNFIGDLNSSHICLTCGLYQADHQNNTNNDDDKDDDKDDENNDDKHLYIPYENHKRDNSD